MGVQRTKVGVLNIRPEATYGTLPAANAVGSVTILPESGSVTVRDVAENTPISLVDSRDHDVFPIITQFMMEITFRVHARSRTVTAPTKGPASGLSTAERTDLHTLFEACDMIAQYTAESVALNDGYVYYSSTRLSDTPQVGPSISIVWQWGGKTYTMTGCKGTFRISASAKKPMVIEFTFRGFQQQTTDTGVPVKTGLTAPYGDLIPTFDGGDAVTITSQVVGAAACVKEFDFSLNNEIVRRDCANSAMGYVGFVLIRRPPLLNVTYEIEPESTNPFQIGFTIGLSLKVGTTVNRRVRLDYNGRITAIDPGDSQGLITNRATIVGGLTMSTAAGSGFGTTASSITVF